MAKQAEWLTLTTLSFDYRLQQRVTHPPTEAYEQLLEDSKASEWPFDTPLKAVRCEDPEGNEGVFVYSGFTRGEAAGNVGRRKVLVEVQDGTWEDAFILSLGENESHGWRRTIKDRRKAVLAAIEAGYPQKKTAEFCGISQRRVRGIVKEAREAEQAKAERKPAKKKKKGSSDNGAVQEEDITEVTGITDPCPVCETVAWIEKDSGTTCRTCGYEQGETPGTDEEEVVYEEISEEDIAAAAARKNLAEIEAHFGRFVRAVDEGDHTLKFKPQVSSINKKLAQLRKEIGRVTVEA